MSISVKEQFEIWKKESSETFDKLKVDTDAVVEPIQRDIKLNTIENIAHDFGKFLYTCLGERVVGLSNQVINMDLMNKLDYPAKAVEAKCTLEEYLEKHDCGTDYRGIKQFKETQAYLTAGRKFGVSYIVRTGKRSHTIFFEEDKIFEYMVQEHVDCIKNKAKKECAQAFLNYRDSFVNDINHLNDDNIFEINVPLKVAKVSTLQTGAKYYTDSYSRNGASAMVVEDITDDVAQFATITTPAFEKWDKISNVNSRDARRGATDLNIAMSVQFGRVTGKSGNYKTVLSQGNVDFAFDKFRHSVDTLKDSSNSPVVEIHETNNFLTFCEIINKDQQQDHYALRNCSKYMDGVPMNVGDVINHPILRKEIQTRIDFFKTKSNALQDMKHSFAGLYFINEG